MTQILPVFRTPDDVRALKVRVAPSVRALDGAVARCAGLDSATKTRWADFAAAWKTYYDEEDSWIHTVAQYETGEKYEREIAGWQEFVAKSSCAVPGPRIEVDPPPSAASSQIQSTVRTVAIVAGVIAGVVALRTVMR